MRLHRLWLLLLASVSAACSQPDSGQGKANSSAATRPGTVYAVNYPLAFFAEYLSEGHLRVEFPAPPDEDPAYWQPDPEIVLAFQQADIILLNGPGNAWVHGVSLPARTQVDTSATYSDRFLPLDGGPVHSHGPEGEHSHGDVAFTTWLDLSLAALQATAVAEALKSATDDPTTIEHRLAYLHAELATLDDQMLDAGSVLNGAPVLFSHPVYQYLSQRYGLNGHALHWEPDTYPGQAQWDALDSLLAEHPARIMIWEAQPIQEVEAELTRRGVDVVVFAPLGNRPVAGDFISAMRANVQSFRWSLRPQQ